MIETIIDPIVKHKILIIGIGKSNTAEVLYNKGFKEIVCIDISETIIAQMSNKYSNFPGIDFFVMDANNLSLFKDDSFTLVIDKGSYYKCSNTSIYLNINIFIIRLFRCSFLWN